MKKWISLACAAVLTFCASGALAAKAKQVQWDGDSVFHANHLIQVHEADTDLICTGNYVKIRAYPSEYADVLGHLEQADGFELLEVKGNWAQIEIQYSAPTSPDNYYGLTGWVDADYIQCPCTYAEYYDEEPVPDWDEGTDWKYAYYRALAAGEGLNGEYDSYGDLTSSSMTYALIYVDNDEIPELVVNTNAEAGGCLVMTYHDNAGLQVLQTQRLGLEYVERRNMLRNSDGIMGYYFDNLYSIQNGWWVSIGSGSYTCTDWSENLGDYQTKVYVWEGDEVTQMEYTDELLAAYDVGYSVTPDRWYTSSEILRILSY